VLTKQNLLLLLIAVSITTPALAKIYKWKDAQGVTHYTATPPPATAKIKSKEIKIKKKPKSSLTHMNVVQIPVEEETSNKRSKVKRKANNSKNNKRQGQKVAKKCTKFSSDEIESSVKRYEKDVKSFGAKINMNSFSKGKDFTRRMMQEGCKEDM